jgi:hypothetical protein
MKRATFPFGLLLAAVFALCATLCVVEHNREAAAEHVDEHIGNEPYLLKPGIIAKNVLLGLSIDVCSNSHPKATAAAVRVWNSGTSRYVDVPLFTFRGDKENCATTGGDKLASILVEWHRSSLLWQIKQSDYCMHQQWSCECDGADVHRSNTDPNASRE